MIQDDEIVGSLLEKIQSINYSKQRSMITIRDSVQIPKNDDISVFPPDDHENLQIPSHLARARDQLKQQDHPAQPPSPSLAPSDLSSAPSSSKEEKLIVGWLDSGLEILRAKVVSVYSWFYNDNGGCGRGAFRSFASASAVAGLALWWWVCRRIKRGRRTTENVEHLKLMVREKDEKISKLLHQIAQMNEVLVARHKALASKMTN